MLAGAVACGSSEPEPYAACGQSESSAPVSLTLLFTGGVDGNLEPCG